MGGGGLEPIDHAFGYCYPIRKLVNIEWYVGIVIGVLPEFAQKDKSLCKIAYRFRKLFDVVQILTSVPSRAMF